jgi:DNA-directed RNA polymerase subunit L
MMHVTEIQRNATGNGACPDGARLKFTVEGMDVSLANAIRRTALSSIPNVALYNYTTADDAVKVRVNTCSLGNEIILHRLRLIPLCFTDHEIETFNSLNYQFVLHKKNTTRQFMSVTTDDFKIVDAATGKPLPSTFVRKVFPHNTVSGDPILITQLKPNLDDPANLGEEIHVEGRAVVDTASTNACFSPISICTYSNVVDQDAVKRAMDKISDKEELSHFNLLQRDRHFKCNEHGEPNAFTFCIETECRLSPEYVYVKAIDVLLTSIRDFAESVLACPASVENDIITFTVPGFDHTVGNLVQSLMYNLCIRHVATSDGDRSQQQQLRYVGYFVPHPLENNMVLRLSYRDTNDADTARNRVRSILLEDVVAYIESFRSTAHAALFADP